ncbi:hypothetical protein PT974_03295 [Cladobotryum mycophilum]|uniref:Uncharacterized protein n=1 Tax=Cladobotryum mycophilum TaxID=491253 RepID=A0ABR0SS23_9HYPO
MEAIGKRPEPPVLKRKGFELCQDRFTFLGVDRVTGSRLQVLFNAPSLPLRRDKKAADEESRKLLKRPSLFAQLKHYGVEFSSTASRDKLESLLRDAVDQGKCEHVAKGVTQLEEEMRRDYEPQLRKWEDEAAAWDAAKKKRDDEAFSKCETPSQKASFDLDRFMNLYFLTDGAADKDKTPEPLVLYDFDGVWKLNQMIGNIVGLHKASGRLDQGIAVCLGWDRSAVESTAEEITNQTTNKKNEKLCATWDKQMEAHHRYMDRLKQSNSTKSNKGSTTEQNSPESFDLQRCVGSYVVKCDAVSEGWDEEHINGGKFIMDISKGINDTLVADYHLGVIKGTMWLSLSEEKLDAIVGPVESYSDFGGSGDEEEEDEEDDDDDDEEEEEEEEEEEKGDENEEVVEREEEEKPKKEKSLARTAEDNAGPAAKRRKKEPSPRRLYYRMRGRETGEGGLFEMESGHLDVTSNECIQFEGLAYFFPFLDSNVKFSGYRVSDKPRKRSTTWYDL